MPHSLSFDAASTSAQSAASCCNFLPALPHPLTEFSEILMYWFYSLTLVVTLSQYLLRLEPLWKHFSQSPGSHLSKSKPISVFLPLFRSFMLYNLKWQKTLWEFVALLSCALEDRSCPEQYGQNTIWSYLWYFLIVNFNICSKQSYLLSSHIISACLFS